ncbi:hypothetical protein [Rhodococcus sp. UNC363MFTsu5.1]|uniref:hypothetical protein n=1 Tax=Rhodococcus sp. UNC363MFTsu5.1 TaxID=1449069 RepID=UPI000AD443B1|nr:hypothetical protein [Rhodococcus sp. UNC363MFTsu5.1]
MRDYGLIPGAATIVQYVSPDGVVLTLSGGLMAGIQGFVLGDGPEGLGSAEAKAIFDGAARQIGEDYVDSTYEHGTIDIPIHVFGDTVDEFRRRREWLRTLIPRERQGWLCGYTSATGWRMIATRRGSIKPAYTRDPAGARGATFDVLLYADNPLARAANHVPREWVNITGASTSSGSMGLYPGPEVPAWPAFIFTGPGELHLHYDTVEAAPVDVAIPYLEPNEVVQIDTEYGAQSLRAKNRHTGARRNLWPLMKGQQFHAPVGPNRVTRVAFTVKRASAATRLWATVAQRQEGLL